MSEMSWAWDGSGVSAARKAIEAFNPKWIVGRVILEFIQKSYYYYDERIIGSCVAKNDLQRLPDIFCEVFSQQMFAVDPAASVFVDKPKRKRTLICKYSECAPKIKGLNYAEDRRNDFRGISAASK
jgi:hypothetical protein